MTLLVTVYRSFGRGFCTVNPAIGGLTTTTAGRALCLVHLFAMLSLASCSSNGGNPGGTASLGAGAAATFATLQTQVFNVSCTFSSCHGGVATQQSLDLSSAVAYENLVNIPSAELAAIGIAENRVTPNQLDQSYLVEKLQSNMPRSGLQMPVGQPLDAARLNLVIGWINAGAPNN